MSKVLCTADFCEFRYDCIKHVINNKEDYYNDFYDYLKDYSNYSDGCFIPKE